MNKNVVLFANVATVLVYIALVIYLLVVLPFDQATKHILTGVAVFGSVILIRYLCK
jgi:hypothetical protein